MITLDIFADITCPWCYLGKCRLDRALESRPGHPFGIAWHPFQIDPSLPRAGMARDAYLRAKFGAEAERIHVPLLEAAAQSGVTLNLAAIRHQPNSLDAHRLVHWAGIEGRQSVVMAALMRGFWREGRDIGAAPVLVDIATEAGMEAAVVARLLAGDADIDTITAREAHARARGISAVPSFILGNRHVIAGAQPPEVWLRVIDEIAATGGGGVEPSP